MINDEIANAIVSRELDLNRFDADLRKRVVKLLKELDDDVTNKLKGNISEWNKTRLNALLKDIKEIVNKYYSDLNEFTQTDLQGVAKSEAKFMQSMISEKVGVDLFNAMPSANQLAVLADSSAIQGATTAQWWQKQSADVYFRVSSQIRMGYGSGEKIGTIADRVQGQMAVTRRNAEALVRTAVHTISSQARERMYAENSSVMKGKVYVAVLDNRTSIQCIAYDGSTYDMDNKPIGKKSLPYRELPAHWNCRSMYMPIIKSWKELGVDFPEIPNRTRSSMDGAVPQETTFAQFLDSKDQAFQDKVLGKGKAQLWRDGKITLQQLLDQTGNPIPLKELDK